MSMAIITGASSGLGRAYALACRKAHPEIDEYLLIARRRERLEALAHQLSDRRVELLALDLSSKDDLQALSQWLAARKPDVRLLINNAGLGWLGEFAESDWTVQARMADVNVSALTAVAAMTLPYIRRGGGMLNVCSIAAYVPTPRMAVYCSTKAYVFSLTKALHCELKPKGIFVMAACPGPMDTEFMEVAGIPKGRSKLFDFCKRVNPDRMAEVSLKKAFQGRTVYTQLLMYKTYRVLCKVLPHNWIMPFTRA